MGERGGHVKKLLCKLGFHDWKLWKKSLRAWSGSTSTYQIYEYCQRCKVERSYLNNEEIT